MHEIERETKAFLWDLLCDGKTTPCPICKRSEGHYGNCVMQEYDAHKLAVEGHYSGIA